MNKEQSSFHNTIAKLERLVQSNESSVDSIVELGGLLKTIVQQLVSEETEDTGTIREAASCGSYINALKSLTTRSLSGYEAIYYQCLAETAKNDVARHLLSDKKILASVIKRLSCEDEAVVHQACRALGNICYENDVARDMVQELDGVKVLMNSLRKAVDSLKNDASTENGVGVLSVLVGCLLNWTASDSMVPVAINAGAIELCVECAHVVNNQITLLSSSSSGSNRKQDMTSALTHALLVLSGLSEAESERWRFLEESVLHQLIGMLSSCDLECVEIVLEILTSLAEEESAQSVMVKNGLLEKLFELSANIRSNAGLTSSVADLVVLLLMSDESVKCLYGEGFSEAFDRLSCWLDDDNDVLRASGALALGNIARTDEYSVRLVNDGIAKKLLDLLVDPAIDFNVINGKSHQAPSGDGTCCDSSSTESGRRMSAFQGGNIKLQHAVLAALRNLSITAENKSKLLEIGALDRLLKFGENIEAHPVVFKWLGCIRMLVDKHESVAIRLGSDSEFVKKLVRWSNVMDHAGVKGEAERVLVGLVKNAPSCGEIGRNIADAHALPVIVSGLLGSQHEIMQMEGFIALTILISQGYGVEDIAEDSEITEVLGGILNEDILEKSVPFIQNALSFCTALIEQPSCSKVVCEYASVIRSLVNHQDANISSAANHLAQRISRYSDVSYTG